MPKSFEPDSKILLVDDHDGHSEQELGQSIGYSVLRPMEELGAVIDGEELLEMQREVENVFIHDNVYKYMALLSSASREHELLDLGLSPRGTLALGKMARAYAYLQGRSYVSPKDVKMALRDVGAHRVRTSQKARMSGKRSVDVLEEVLARVRAPRMGEA